MAALIHSASTSRATLWLPSYFCPEVADACRQLCELREYEDDPRLPEPNWSSLSTAEGDFVLAVNYFGVREAGPWQHWREHNRGFLIEDHTQDPFSPWCQSSTADYAFASLRKTVPVSDGALLWSPRGLPLPAQPSEQESDWRGSAVKMSAMLYKANYLAGLGNDLLKAHFRNLQARGEEQLRSSPIAAMSPYSLAYIANGAPALWREQRSRNANRLKDRLIDLTSVELMYRRWPEGAVPFVLPLLFESQSKRDRWQEYLQKRAVYCPVHWICQTKNTQSIDLCSRVLSLPIDQRYTESEMDCVADILEDAATSFSSRAATAETA